MLDLATHYIKMSQHLAIERLQHCRCRHQTKLTGQAEQNDPVDEQDRPEDRNVEDLGPSAEESNHDGSRGRVPELELRKTADERAELFVLLRGQS